MLGVFYAVSESGEYGWKETLRIAFTRNYFNMQIRKCEVELCFDVVGKVGYADVFFKLMAVRD